MDFMCPPPCPCRVARWGVALLTWCVYSALFAPVFFNASFAAAFFAAMHGDISIRWTGAAIIGLACLFGGLHRIRRSGHELQPGSVLWSLLVVAAVTYFCWLLRNAPRLNAQDAQDFHLVRMLMIGWAVSNAFNLWLQFHFRRSVFITGWKDGAASGIRHFPAMQHATRTPPRAAPDVIASRGAVPQVGYVTRAATSVPVFMPDAARDRRR